MKFSPLFIAPILAFSASIVNASPTEPVEDSHSSISKDRLSTDFINFVNDDTLHGNFMGFTTSGKIIWKNIAAEKNIAFTPDQVRKVVINKGKLVKPFTHHSFITLTNQDTIPGKIIKLNDKQVTLETDFAGKIKVPRELIGSIDFLPLGDKIIYRGPFSDQDWTRKYYNYRSNDNTPETDRKPSWEHKNFGLWTQGQSGVILHNDEMKDIARYTFKINHKSSVLPSFVIAANLEQPETKKEKDKKAILPAPNNSAKITQVLGSSLILRLRNYSSTLSFYGFAENGQAFTQNLTNLTKSARPVVSKEGSLNFDVRMNKEEKLILLYSEGTLLGKWDFTEYDEKLTGSRIGFANLYGTSTSAAIASISDIVISSWNGIIEPAASMTNPDRDTVLLTNGTDRYSGDAITLAENKLQLKAAYADLAIPTDQIQSLFLATKGHKKMSPRTEDEVSIRFHGTGRLTGAIAKGDNGKIILKSKVLGDLNINTEYISSYEFEDNDFAFELIN